MNDKGLRESPSMLLGFIIGAVMTAGIIFTIIGLRSCTAAAEDKAFKGYPALHHPAGATRGG